MKYYKSIPIWENIRRTKLLKQFRRLTLEYFDNIEFDGINIDPNIGKKGLKIRQEINQVNREIGIIIRTAGIPSSVKHFPAPAVGGFVTDVDLITNIFNLHSYDIPPIQVIDVVDQAIGVYLSNRFVATVRTVNPFFWISILLTWLASLPFRLISSAGFDAVKIKKSVWGKLISLMFQSIVLMGTVLTILQILGYSNLIEVTRKTLDGFIK